MTGVTVSLIAAVAKNGVIGREGSLPWRIPEDLSYFKRVTMGHPVIMGRKTLEAIGKPLSGRRNIVLSRDPAFAAEGCEVAGGADAAIALAGSGEVFVIGGAAIYTLFFPMASRLYITRIEAEVPGDAFFPAFNETDWRVIRREPGIVDSKNTLRHEFLVYEKIGK